MHQRYASLKQLILFIILITVFGNACHSFSGSYKSHQEPFVTAFDDIKKFDLVIKGKASWYGSYFHGRKTANGETYDMYTLTAAHKSLPFNSLVRVTNLANHESVIVRINDRGPYIRGRDIDLSFAAAQQLDMVDYGVAPVKLEILKPRKS